MTDDTPDRDELLGFLAEDGRRKGDPEDHPSIETLSAYGTGRLSEEESERVQDHLVACRECSGLVLSLKEILRAPQAESAPVAPAVPVVSFAGRKPPSRSVMPAYALAA
ncbi:MAG: zf-HC2 domain-containing protein, partial [Thermoanaerobaculia bacterium]